jgi:2-polyprenyl-3-methyl-5-hydroxy-6-metoxy-1,4-benzoquinol methylase
MAGADPISLQQRFWNDWNASNREDAVDGVAVRQAEVVCAWLGSLGRRDLDIVEVGCGAGWFCPELARYGRVTGTDLSNEVLARVQHRTPNVTFISGDFMHLDFGLRAFDVVVTLEVLSHVADQQAFLTKLASHLRPGGHLMMATQNRFVLQYLNRIGPPAPGQLRRWVDKRELRALLEPQFEVLELFSVTPRLARGTIGLIKSKLGWRGHAVADDQTKGPAERSGHQARFGDRTRRWMVAQLEAMGLGWTLMALARKPASS